MVKIGSSETVRVLVARMPQPVLVANDSRTYIDANEAACSLLRLPRDAIVGRLVEDFVPTELREYVPGEWAKFLKEGAAGGSYGLLRSDGTLLELEFSAVANVAPGEHVSFLQDLTERKREQREQAEAKRLAELALDAGHMGSWIYSVDMSKLACNHRLLEIYGLASNVPITHQTFLSCVHPEDMERVQATVGDALRGRTSYELEFRIVRTDGALRWLTDQGGLLFADGVCNGIAGVTWDITERRRAEEDLRQSERRFRTLIEQSPFSTQLFAPDGSTRMVNQAWKELWGADSADIQGYNVLHDPQLVELGIMEQIRRAFQTGLTCELPDIPYRPPAGKSKGKELWIRGFVYPVKDEHGKVTEVVLVHEDVTSDRHIEAERASRARELARSNAELQRFSYVASHDLKEPLRNVCAFSQMLHSRLHERLDKDDLEMLELITGGAKRMSGLIDSLLAYSQASLHRDPVFVEASADDLFSQAIQNLRVSIDQTGTVVEAAPLPNIRCAPMEIVQLMQNLLGNAIKYRSDRPCRVRVYAEDGPLEWTFVVADNGIGIEPKFHDQIFGVFARLHSDEYSGTGIGLAICKAVVEKHGGRIWVDSAPGEGCTFRFTIPK